MRVTSSLVIVPVAVRSPLSAPLTLVTVTVKVSVASTAVSPLTTTVNWKVVFGDAIS